MWYNNYNSNNINYNRWLLWQNYDISDCYKWFLKLMKVNIINKMRIIELVEMEMRKHNINNGTHYSRRNYKKWNYSYNIHTITIRIKLN